MSLEFVDRRGTSSLKWDLLDKIYGDPDLISMWVADMDFMCPPCAQEAMAAYMSTQAYGYAALDKGVKDAFVDWERTRHGLEVHPDWIKFAPGVVPALYWCVLALSEPGDAILITPPVYHPFFGVGEERQRKLVESLLVCTDGRWEMNFDDIEEKIVANDVKMFVLCSPHNPCGRIWTRAELERLADICNRHGVIVVSDEIHQDFEMPSYTQIPFLTLQTERCVMLTAGSKTFNLAGLKTALVVIADEELRDRFDKFVTLIDEKSCNSLGCVASAAAWAHGASWLDEICAQVWDNYCFMRKSLLGRFEKLVAADLEGTYLAWFDFGAYVCPEEIEDFFTKECRLAVDYGSMFRGGADTWARFNLATSHEIVERAVENICAALETRAGA